MSDDRKGRGKELAAAALKYVILIFWALTTIIPLLWVFINSFKTSEEIVKNGVALPAAIQLGNYKTIMSYPDMSMSRAFLNSFIISGSVVIGVVLVAGLAAFALGRFRFTWTRYADAVLIACLLVPSFATMIPNFVTISKLPIRGTHAAAIIPQIAGNLCFSITLLTGFMRSFRMNWMRPLLWMGLHRFMSFPVLPCRCPNQCFRQWESWYSSGPTMIC